MARILIKNGRVWDGYKFFYADILTDRYKIVKIEPDIITDEVDLVYDATGKIVSAGLVDAHMHIRVLSDDKYGISPEIACFPFGVTAAADAGRTFGDRAVLDIFMLRNVVFVCPVFENGHIDAKATDEAIERFGDKTVGIKIFFTTSPTASRDISYLAEICDFAKKRDLPVMVHCTDSPTKMSEILNTLSSGDILTHAYHGGVNNATEDDFESMIAAKERGVVIDTGFAADYHVDFNVFRKAIEKGVLPNTISTDITRFSAYFTGGRYGMTMCMSMARHMGMSEEDIFRAVTTTPASVLGKTDEWGTLKVDGVADIAVFDYTNEGFSIVDTMGNHIESDMSYRCALTVLNGRVVYRD